LGYQRRPDDKAGRWILRRYADRAYRILPLGQADDTQEADGRRVLSYEQAYAAAIAAADAQTKVHLMTVRQAMERYIEFKRQQGQSVTDLVSRSAAHILAALGHLVVEELTADRLRKWLATMAAMPKMLRSRDGAEQRYGAEPVSDDDVRRRRASANRVLTYLKASLNHCFDEGHVPSNEAWGRKLKPFRDVEVARVRYLSVAEAKRLINAGGELRQLVQAALFTGCRYGELIRLETCDYNDDSGTLAIRKSKSGKSRHVVLTDEGVEFFRHLAAKSRGDETKSANKSTPSGAKSRAGGERMFTRADGSPWKASQQARLMLEACRKAKIDPQIGFHQLRHSYASLCAMNGVSLQILSQNLGHADMRMCERFYAHLAPSHVAEAIRQGAPKFGSVRGRALSAVTTAR
jgi:integrase